MTKYRRSNLTQRWLIIVVAAMTIVIGYVTSHAADHDAEILYRKARTTLDADSAAEMYKQVVEMFPRDTLAAWSMLRLAQYASANNNFSNVEAQVIRLRELFPHSEARKEAAALLPERHDEPIVAAPVHSSKPKISSPAPIAVEKKAPLVPAAAPPPFAAGGSFGVQLGAFAVKANAERMKTLASATLPTEIVERVKPSGTLYLVIAGKLKSQAEAQVALTHLEKETGVRGVVIAR